MRLLRGAIAAFAFFAPIATAAAQEPSTRERDAIGAIEIIIDGPDLEQPITERATGVIVSPAGHVLSAAHIFNDEAFAVCTAAANAPPGLTCSISFYLKGNTARRAAARILSARSPTHDYVVLTLPPANDVLDRPEWPYVFVGETPRAGAVLFASGYDGNVALRSGAPNPLAVIPGAMSASPTQSCTEGEGWGVSNLMTGQTSPGFSGGPVFNARRRLVGIVLGRSCATDLQAATQTRLLTIASIPNFCATVTCRYGFAGFIAPYDGSNPRDWRERLESGPNAADEFVYEWRLSALSQLTDWSLLCLTFNNPANPQSGQRLRADFEAGGELASVYHSFVASTCIGGAESSEANTLRTRITELAEAGFEPAQYLAAQIIFKRLEQKLSLGAATASYAFTATERAEMARAERYLRLAGEAGWGAALFSHFEICRMRAADCAIDPRELERAADLGVWNARRTLAIYLLQGDTSATWRQRWNFSMRQDIPRALELLAANVIAVQPSAFPAAPILDNPSAATLAYIYGGGRINAREVATPNLMQAVLYEQYCLAGQQPNPQIYLHAQCVLNGAVARFNLGNASDKQAARGNLVYMKDVPNAFGLAAQNLLAWLDSGENIVRMSCDLNDDFDFAPPAQRAREPGVAYCHYPPHS